MSSSPEPERDDTSAAMAAAMGFSSFGAPPSKKRRFNPHADAFTASPPTTSANAIPLHPRDTTAAAPSSSSDGDVQAQIDAIVASGNATYGLETSQLDGHGPSRHGFRPGVVADAPNAGKSDMSGMAAGFHPMAGAPGTADGPSLVSSSSLPQPPAAGSVSQIGGGPGEGLPSSRQGGGGGGEEGSAWNGGEFFINPRWYAGYYDATTNENPWARLETKMGLPPAPGTWLVAGVSSSSSKRGKGRGG